MTLGLRSRGALLLAFGVLSWIHPGPQAAAAQAQVATQAQPAPRVTLDAPVVSDLQEILLDLRIGRLASRTVRALTEGSEAYLPVSELLALGEVDHTVEDTGVVRAVIHPGARLVVLDPVAGQASREGRPFSLPAAAMAEDSGTLYVAASVLESLFDLTIRTDWSRLTAVVMDPQVLPLGRRMEREARWRRVTGATGSGAPDARIPLDQGRFGGAVVDWSLSSNVNDPSGTTSYAVGAGARVFDGNLQMSSRSLGPTSTGEHQVDATYQTVWSDRSWITQMRLGDGFSSGPRLRSVRGISLTNAPFVRRSFFGVDSFSGRVGPGWDVELKQANRTVDVTRADEQGAFALDIPLAYGTNSVEVVAFGPHGEIVTTERLVLLGTDRLPADAFEWSLSGGACRDARCAGTANLDLRYGLSDRWTLRGGTEAFTRDTLPSLVQPYLGVTGVVLPGLQLASEVLHGGFLRGGATYAPSSRLRVRSVFTAFSSAVEGPVLHDARRQSTTETDVLFRPLASHPRWLVRGAWLRQALDSGTLSLIQAASVFQLGNVGFESGLRRDVDDPDLGARSTRDYLTGAVTGLVPLPGRRKLWARGEVELLDASALQRVRGRVAYQVTPGARLEIGSGWHRTFGADLTVTFSAYLSQLRSLTQMVAPEGVSARVTQVTQGTVHWNEATRQMSLSPGPGLERGGISGYVFVDDNGNGVRDPGEPGLDGARVVIGGRTVRTDADGRHRTWDLVPFEPVRVWVDPSSITDPRLVPVLGEVEVVVPPSSFGRLDIPVTFSQEIWGSVVRSTSQGEAPLPYAELELVDLGTGEGRAVRAFSDGDFYESGIKPGRYELRITPGSLRGLGVVPEQDAYPVDIEVNPTGAPPDPILIRLTPAPAVGDAG
ncbi:MAG: hypothetical protein WD995_05165 [Gemmatimonadota bacterium]